MTRLNAYVPTVLRIALGVIFLGHAYTKAAIYTFPGTEQFFVANGFPAWTAGSCGKGNGPTGFGRYDPKMRNVLPDLSVNIAPVFPALKIHFPSGPTVTECSE